jgi:hypothetical protein
VVRHRNGACDRKVGRRIQSAAKDNQFGPLMRVPSLKRRYDVGGRWNGGMQKEPNYEEPNFKTCSEEGGGMVVTMGHNGATEIQKTQIHR